MFKLLDEFREINIQLGIELLRRAFVVFGIGDICPEFPRIVSGHHQHPHGRYFSVDPDRFLVRPIELTPLQLDAVPLFRCNIQMADGRKIDMLKYAIARNEFGETFKSELS